MSERSTERGASPPGAGALFVDVALYQAGWFAIVVGAGRGWGGAGAVLALLLVAVHLALVRDPRREAALVAAAGAVGLIAESLVASLAALAYAASGPAIGPVPGWVVVLWLQFATLFHFALRWLSGRLVLAAVLGFVGAPVSFLAGERLGAAAFGEPRTIAILQLALVWAVAFPLLVWIADRLRLAPPGYRFEGVEGDDRASRTPR